MAGEENLVIVESPAKAKTIEKFLGKNFTVVSSYGHVRDLSKKNMGVDVDNHYQPNYVIPDEKKKVVAELKARVKKAKKVWLASDEDREGEAIAWHLAEILGLKDSNTFRIVFNEITKDAILRAIEHPRKIDYNLVNAQQARRILDRLVGFELSPLLWKKIRANLSAGRVQSVAVRLIVEREREIMAFQPVSSYKVSAIFTFDEAGSSVTLPAELQVRFSTAEEACAFLEKCKQATYTIQEVVTKPVRKSPPPPFTTSTLQQEASRKLGFSVAQTMAIAQRLYESGKITYMRTDSVNLSDMALGLLKKNIHARYGESYYQFRQYKTKTKGAQEAHEAIRPAYIDQESIAGTAQEKKLYELIYKRTLASQMSDAQLEKTIVTIAMSTASEVFMAEGEVIKFDGFLKVYRESSDEESEEQSILIPQVKKGQPLYVKNIEAVERFTTHPPRYTEASLVRKLEELGIGRPSTYAPTIATIQQRGYVVKENRPGQERKYNVFMLHQQAIQKIVKTEITGAEKNKLFPTDMGMLVTDFLMTHFPDILDYNFTATVEEDFDEIAEGTLEWTQMIDRFYKPFHRQVETVIETSERSVGERRLGTDPATGEPVIVRMGRFGPMVQIGESDGEKKPRYARLQKGQHIENITLEEALNLFRLPRTLGTFEKADVIVNIGRFGPYLQHDAKFYSLGREDDPYTITLEKAIEIIQKKREQEKNKIIKKFDSDKEILVLNGRYGPYLSYAGNNYKIPKDKEPSSLTLEECMEIIQRSTRSSEAKAETKKRESPVDSGENTKKGTGKAAAKKATSRTRTTSRKNKKTK